MADAIFKQCLDQIVTDIQGLSLDNVDSTEVVSKWRRWEMYRFDKTITVHPGKPMFVNGLGTCGKDDIGYNCQVSIIIPQEGDDTKAITRITQYLEDIRSKFINQRLGSITTVWKCEVLTRNVKLPPAFDRDRFIGEALIVRAWSRETRG